MKKMIILLVLLVYGTASFGMTIHLHYCCGQLESVGLGPRSQGHCPAEKRTQLHPPSCCADKSLDWRIRDDQQGSRALQPDPPVQVTADLFFDPVSNLIVSTYPLVSPVFGKPLLFLRNRVLRI